MTLGENEGFVIDGKIYVVMLAKVKGHARLGIHAPEDMKIAKAKMATRPGSSFRD